MDAHKQPKALTAAEVLGRYTEEELPDFVEIPLEDVNQVGNFGDRPLHVAATRGNIDEIVALVGAGADVNASGEKSYTPLHAAASQGHFDAVKFLLENGASPTKIDEFGESVLDVARRLGHNEIARLIASWHSPRS
jgi:ankyrin repeat protein